jgi:hypothetical protein
VGERKNMNKLIMDRVERAMVIMQDTIETNKHIDRMKKLGCEINVKIEYPEWFKIVSSGDMK